MKELLTEATRPRFMEEGLPHRCYGYRKNNTTARDLAKWGE